MDERDRQDERTRALTVLALARDLVGDKARWVKHHFAVDPRGKATDPWDPGAARWCAAGAVLRVVRARGAAHWVMRARESLGRGEVWELLARACGARPGPVGAHALSLVIGFNDWPTTTHTDVLALFDRAIELGRGK